MGKIQIEMQLFGSLRRFSDLQTNGSRSVTSEMGTSVGNLLDQVRIDKSEVGFVQVNGDLSSFGRRLESGDTILLVGHVAGG